MLDCIFKDISFKNWYKIVLPLFGAAYTAPNKGTQVYTE